MNTTAVKSLGLALAVAVGVLALLLALGTFNPGKAGAAVEADSVTLDLSTVNADSHVKVDVSFQEGDNALQGADAITIAFTGLVLAASIADDTVTVTGPLDGGGTFTHPVPASGMAVSAVVAADPTADPPVQARGTLTITLPADGDDLNTDAEGIQEFTSGLYTVTIAAGDDTTPVFKTVAAFITGTDATTPVAPTEVKATVTTTAASTGIDSNTIRAGYTKIMSSQDAGAAVSLSLTIVADAVTANIPAGEDIVIDLAGFQIPGTIDADSIYLADAGDGSNAANAADVTVNGSKMTIEVPDMNPADATREGILATQGVIIRFRSRAGIANPVMAGDSYAVKAATDAGAELYNRNPGRINETLTVSPASGIEGTEFTVSGVGYANGTVTVYHTGNLTPPPAQGTTAAPDGFAGIAKQLASATVSGGSFSTTVTAAAYFSPAGNEIIARSATGHFGPVAVFSLNGAIAIPESATKGTDLTIKVSKWLPNRPITRVTINGEDMAWVQSDGTLAENFSISVTGSAEFTIRVGAGALLGEQTLVVYTRNLEGVVAPAGQRNITITQIELTVRPSTAAVGQETTVPGSGFSGSVDKITLNGATHCDSDPTTTNIADCGIAVASGGRVVAAFRIPNDEALAKAGDYNVTIADTSDRVGAATVTIPERTLALDPAESRIGSTITVSGTGWPTGTGASFVGLYYDGDLRGSATTASDGTWSASLEIPGTAGVGTPHKVEAKATVGGVKDANVTKEAEHKTPDGVVTLSADEAERGTKITVTGANFHTFQPVTIDIGGSNVTPSALTTDAKGSFSAPVLVPGLDVGTHNVKVTVNTVTIVEFLRIINTPPDATLSALALSDLTLSPAFDADTTSYTAEAAHDMAQTTISAMPTDSTATVAYAPADAEAGTSGHQVGLDAGDNTITVTVTAADGSTTQDYTVTVNRAAEPPSTAVNDVLADLIAGGNLEAAWLYDRATGAWALAYSNNPLFAAAITVTELNAGDILWVKVTEDQTFSGFDLVGGRGDIIFLR